MELRQLRFFVEVAKSGSLNKAARRLSIAQPALSRQVQTLEQELGSPLFARHATGVKLTREGRRLLSHAEELLRQAERIRDHLADDTRPVSGSVTVGAAPAVGQHFFGPIAERAAADHPSVKITFAEGHAFDMLAGLEKGEIDFAFMIDPEPQRDVEITPLFSEPLYLVGPRDQSDFPKTAVALSALKQFPLAIYPRLTGPRKAIDKALAKARATLNVRYETNFHPTIKDLVRRRLAFAVMTRSAIADDLADFSVAPIRELMLLRTLVTIRQRPQSEAVAALIAIAKSETRTIVSGKHFEGCRYLL